MTEGSINDENIETVSLNQQSFNAFNAKATLQKILKHQTFRNFPLKSSQLSWTWTSSLPRNGNINHSSYQAESPRQHCERKQMLSNEIKGESGCRGCNKNHFFFVVISFRVDLIFMKVFLVKIIQKLFSLQDLFASDWFRISLEGSRVNLESLLIKNRSLAEYLRAKLWNMKAAKREWNWKSLSGEKKCF